MKKLLIGLLAALLAFGSAVSGVSAAERRSEMPLMYDIRGGDPTQANRVLARLVAESLKENSDGTVYIKGSPCTTPNDIYHSIVDYHPEVRSALPNVEALPAFLRVLIPHKARDQGLTGMFTFSRMLCTKPDTRQDGDELDLGGREREFRAEELAWYHPNFNDPLIAGECSNGIKKRVISPPPVATVCEHIVFTVGQNDTAIRIGEARKPGAPALGRECPTSILRPGGSGYELVRGKNECPERVCNFAEIKDNIAKYGYGLDYTASFALVPGTYTLQVARAATEVKQGDLNYPYLFIFCIESWQGPAPPLPKNSDSEAVFTQRFADINRFVTTHSHSSYVSANDFVSLSDGSRLATIYPTMAAAMRAGTQKRSGGATELWWHY